MAWGFAYVYVFVQVLVPGSFTAAVAPSNDRTWMELLFLSFTNLRLVQIFSLEKPIVPLLPSINYVSLQASRKLTVLRIECELLKLRLRNLRRGSSGYSTSLSRHLLKWIQRKSGLSFFLI